MINKEFRRGKKKKLLWMCIVVLIERGEVLIGGGFFLNCNKGNG